jgi:putative alpha-1,2-mannosidase
MAKKAVATFSGDRAAKRNYVKCIRMDRSPRTGSYIFKEELVQTDQIKEYFAKK